MPVFSYVAIPRNGDKMRLFQELQALENCVPFPADNADIVILVTDSPDKETEEKLQLQLQNVHSLESLHMTFGWNDEINMEEGENHEA